MKLYEQLSIAKVEKDVENIGRTILCQWFPGSKITSPYGTDGVLINNNLNISMLLEFKYDLDLLNPNEVMKVLIQCIYYLKKFLDDGNKPPIIIFVCDINELFYIHYNSLESYLKLDNIDWTIAPSAAGNNNDLIKLLLKDFNVTPYIYTINNKLDEKEISDGIIKLSKQETSKIKIIPGNIDNIFHFFINNVLRKKEKYNTNEQVSIFLNIIINPKDNYLHPKSKSILITKANGDININNSKFNSLFNHFEENYSPREKERMTSVCDRLIEDETRRRHGDFYTPTIWVNESHKMIEEQFGKNWKEDYIIWDCAWGTGNLTRDYYFKELYCSTLNQGDIDIGKQAGYNQNAILFQFDFLNDDFDKIPKKLKEVFEKRKPIIFFINPPYGTAKNGGSNKNNSKIGISDTRVGRIMRNAHIGKCSAQLYGQFLYRIIKLSLKHDKVNIAIFSPPLYKIGKSWKNFRKIFYNKFKFLDGMLFNASYFSNTKSTWGIDFSLWKSGMENKYILPIKIKEKNLNGIIKIIKNKNLYSLENDSLRASNWVRELTITSKNIKSYPNFTSALKVKDKYNKKIDINGYLGGYVELSNSVYQNKSGVSLGSGVSLLGYTVSTSIYNHNFLRCISMFTARKIITPNWINQKDEYMIPNINHPEYKQWNEDCIIYSLFNNSSQQSSLRDIEYKNKLWDVKNEWFWMSNNEIRELANKYKYDELYQDTKKYPHEKFVYKVLQNINLSSDAQEVLDFSKELIIKSFEFREILNNDKPEFYLDTWDAGWHQIKKILNEYLKDDLKKFNILYKNFENRMREGVYKFGFLK